MDYFLGILLLINTIEKRIITAKSGRIIQVGNSGMEGVAVGIGEREINGRVIVLGLLQPLDSP
jgi:hypothetical protein